MKRFVYILRNPENKLYIGHTNNLSRRLNDHRTSNGSKFTRDYKNFDLVYSEEFPNLIDAMRRETQLKGWTRGKKEALIAGDLGLLKKL